MEDNLLESKRILIVDDEPDVLNSLGELLAKSEIVTASSFSEGRNLLENQKFDIAILDIMGVDGYRLLEIAHIHKVIPVMLTAHALTPDDARKSFRKGAAFYIPKERMSDIESFLNDVLVTKQKGNSLWWRWIERLGDYFEEKFGPDWQKKDQ